MKKILLLSAAMLVSFGIMAQTSVKSTTPRVDIKKSEIKGVNKVELKDVKKVYPVEKESNYNPVASPVKKLKSKNPKGAEFTQISTSANVFSVLLTAQNCLAANDAGNLISFAHRRSAALGSGNIQISYSTDRGNTFDDQSLTIWESATGGFPGRYPANVIYNPNGLSDLGSIYAVAAGPTLASTWNGGFFASKTFTGENYNYSMSMLENDTNNFLPRYHIQVSGEKVFLYGNNVTDNGAEYTGVTTVINIGTWNATTNSFDWTLSEFSPNDDIIKRANGSIDSWGPYPAMAFADDGLTGYLIYTGRDKTAEDTLSYLPMIYKTTDGALTWTKIPFDWRNAGGSLVADLEYLASVNGGPGRPMFSEIKDATVDGMGQLHFVSIPAPAASDNPDSLGYYMVYRYINGYIYDTYLTNNDENIVSFVVAMHRAEDNNKETTLIDPNTTSDYVTWDERLQIGKSIDGMNIVFAWMDTDSIHTVIGEDKPINNYPNVHVAMLDIAEQAIGEANNVTNNEYGESPFADMCYWMYLSNDILEEGTDFLYVPISVSTLSPASDDPVEHWYINNTLIDKATGLIGVKEQNPIISETSIYPNPTSGNVNISFNDNAKGKYNINVFNAIGSLVYSENIDVNSSVIRTINLENMPNGIYMVQISNNNSTNTQKVIKY